MILPGPDSHNQQGEGRGIRMAFTMEGVVALAPDDASAKAAKGLVSPAKWPLLGADDHAVWGECQGSGSKPYQTQVDLNGPAFRCSCPSRKFPCKHGLALLMIQAQNPQLFQATTPPAWVSEWLGSRADKAQQKEVRQAEKAAAPVDEQAQAKREAQRWQRMETAGQELQRWLCDQVSRGLGSLNAEVLQTWQTMAARMVDAQAPGLGVRIREAAAGIRDGEDWPERTLARLGLMQLACEALQRRASLPPALQAELRAMLGWPHDKAEVLEHGERVDDHWTVLGVVAQDRDDKLTERRVWLHGARSQRRALLWDHAFGGRGFEQSFFAGTGVSATLAFFPGTAGLRAQVVDQAGPPAAPQWPDAGTAHEWDGVARRIAASPWVFSHPVVMHHAVPLLRDSQPYLHADGHLLPLAVGDADLWTLLAATGGHAVHLACEWDGSSLVPMTAWDSAPPQPRAEAPAPSPLWQRSAA